MPLHLIPGHPAVSKLSASASGQIGLQWELQIQGNLWTWPLAPTHDKWGEKGTWRVQNWVDFHEQKRIYVGPTCLMREPGMPSKWDRDEFGSRGEEYLSRWSPSSGQHWKALNFASIRGDFCSRGGGKHQPIPQRGWTAKVVSDCPAAQVCMLQVEEPSTGCRLRESWV